MEGFQLKQGWDMFYRPVTMVRAESVVVGRALAAVNGEEAAGVVGGEGGVAGVRTLQVRERPEQPVEEVVVGDRKKAKKKKPVGIYEALQWESRAGSLIIDGKRGAGKSIVLLQAMAWAHQRQWLVITVPNGTPQPSPTPPSHAHITILTPPSPGPSYRPHGVRTRPQHQPLATETIRFPHPRPPS